MTPPLGKDMHEQMAEREAQQVRKKMLWDVSKVIIGFIIAIVLLGTIYGDAP